MGNISFLLDSCFSGAGGRSVLAAGARPLVPQVTANDDLGGVVLLAAASADEITGTLKEQAHGIFTYYLLKGLVEAGYRIDPFSTRNAGQMNGA